MDRIEVLRLGERQGVRLYMQKLDSVECGAISTICVADAEATTLDLRIEQHLKVTA
jgi:hypothetical protein